MDPLTQSSTSNTAASFGPRPTLTPLNRQTSDTDFAKKAGKQFTVALAVSQPEGGFKGKGETTLFK